MAAPLLGIALRFIVPTGARGIGGVLLRDAAARQLGAGQTERKMRVATAIALTRTAQRVQRDLTDRLGRDFDAPVPFTKRAIGYRPANRVQLSAEVYVRDAQLKYLAPSIFGGQRPPKRFEQRLQGDARRARVPGALPGAGVRLNASGNVPKATLLRLLKDAKTKGSGVFITDPGGHLAPGVWKRVSRIKVAPLLLFARTSPRYSRRFDFFGHGQRAVRSHFPVEFERAVKQIFSD
jgi:hypothetical protein